VYYNEKRRVDKKSLLLCGKHIKKSGEGMSVCSDKSLTNPCRLKENYICFVLLFALHLKIRLKRDNIVRLDRIMAK
jgi:hypothetical protein